MPVEAPTVRSKPKPEYSVIQIAQECARMIESGEARNKAELARKLNVTRPRVIQLLNLLRLAPAIQHYLIKTIDHSGQIKERHLRPLTQMPAPEIQIKAFKKILSHR